MFRLQGDNFNTLAQVKKLIAISFMLSFLFAYTQAGELLKLPFLIHHYLDHHDSDAGEFLLDFLYKHYSEPHTHAPGNGDHEKLPFKSHTVGFLQTSFVFHRSMLFLPELCPALPKKRSGISNAIFFSSPFLSLIWQPPKSC